MSSPAPVIHWTPEEEFYAACGSDGNEGDLATLNSSKVTCPDCLAKVGLETDVACRDGIAAESDPSRWCWRVVGHEPPHRDAFGREWTGETAVTP